MPNRFALLVSLALLSSLPLMAADPVPAPASASFALISPEVAGNLKSHAASPEAQAAIARADAGLKRAPRPFQYHVEGTLPHQGTWDQSIAAIRDFPTMLDLGLAYRLTGDKRYLESEAQYLSAWLDLYKVSLNPIDETGLDRFILGYDLTSADLAPEVKGKMKGFFTALAAGYLEKIDQQKTAGKIDIDNWQSHRIKLITLAAFALGDAALIERAHQVFAGHIAVNISPEGVSHDFIKRDALHYTVYDLEPLCVAALAAKEHGQDWYRSAKPDAPSIQLGLDWLTPYALGQKTHEEFVHSTVSFDAKRAQAGLKGYSGQWEPAGSYALYQIASMLDPKYQAIFEKVPRPASPEAGESIGRYTLLKQAGL